jgi:uncharacterized protein (TIGR00725 family)
VSRRVRHASEGHGGRDPSAPARSLAPQIAVVGPSDASAQLCEVASEIGRRLAEARAIVVCGGLGGIMEAVCRGVWGAGGTTIGILPGADRATANAFVDVAIPSGLGEGRNALVARAGDAMIAIGGGYGTLAEIAFALRAGTAVIGLDTWELGRGGQPVAAVVRTRSAQRAVELALERARDSGATPAGRGSRSAGSG